MELSEFVEECLSQILEGIRKAQTREGGKAIAAVSHSVGANASQLFHSPSAGTFTVVDFDVAVVAETKGGGQGGIRVWGIDAGGNFEHLGQNTSRVKFAVHVKLPEGEPRDMTPERRSRATNFGSGAKI